MSCHPIQREMFPSVKTVEARRDRGVQRGLTHAEQEKIGWRNLALQALGRFLTERGELPFLAEIFRVYATQHNVPEPPDGRAWGAVMTAAKREKLIESCGYAPALTSNLSPKVLWKKK